MNSVILVTDEPLALTRVRLDDDPELAPGAAIVGTYLVDALITRAVADADWETASDLGLLDVPRQLHYQATEIEGATIRAELGAVIPAVDLPHIFERFYRGRNVAERSVGSGIGLASVHQIVTHHGGTVDVTSQEGVGTTFTIRLPLNAPPTATTTGE